MKKARFIAVLASSILLAGCTSGGGNSSSNVLPEVPETPASSVTRDDMVAELGKAYYHLMSSEKLGLDLQSDNQTVKVEEFPIEGTGGTSSAPTITYGELRNSFTLATEGALISLDVEGLQSEGSQVKAAASVEVDKVKFTLDKSTDYEGLENFEANNVKVAAYQSEGTLYADLSNEGFASLLTTLESMLGSANIEAKKYSWSGSMNPLTTVVNNLSSIFGHDVLNNMGTLDEAGSSLVNLIKQGISSVAWLGEVLDQYLEYSVYSDGRKAIIADIENADELADIVATVVCKMQGVEVTDEIKAQAKVLIAQYVGNFEGFELILQLDASSRLLGLSIDTKMDDYMTSASHYKFETGEWVYTAMFYDIDADLSLALSYGDEVTVTLPSDFSDYEPFSVPESSVA